MEAEKCDCCGEPRDSCTCFCSVCRLSFFDRRKPRIGEWQLWLRHPYGGKKICDRCLKCGECGKSKTFENRKGWTNISGGRNATSPKWYCPEVACRAAYANDPSQLERKARDKEKKVFEADGKVVLVGIHLELQQMMPLECFGIRDNQTFRTRKELTTLFASVISRLLGHHDLRLEVADRLTKQFAMEMNHINESSRGFRAAVEDRIERRVAKYPDEKRDFPKIADISRVSDVYSLVRVLRERQRCFGLQRVNRYRGTLEALREPEFHAGLAIWHLCRSIIDRTSLDGMQPLLIAMLKKWWDLGYYPASAKDYTDILLPRIRKVIHDFLRPIPKAIGEEAKAGEVEPQKEYNADAKECVVCLGQHKQLVRFQPCGHRLVCEKCAPALSRCVVCMVLVKTKTLVDWKPVEPGAQEFVEDDEDSAEGSN